MARKLPSAQPPPVEHEQQTHWRTTPLAFRFLGKQPRHPARGQSGREGEPKWRARTLWHENVFRHL